MGFRQKQLLSVLIIILSVSVQVQCQDDQCVDTSDNCAFWASEGECEKNPTWMPVNCPVSCNTCPTTQQPQAATEILSQVCSDLDNLCPLRVISGECESDVEGMTQDCPHACGFCEQGKTITRIVTVTTSTPTTPTTTTTTTQATTTTDDCVDNEDQCPTWASNGECDNNPNYMLLYCKLSCDVCPTTTPADTEDDMTTESCSDDNLMCDYWASTGECSHNPNYMLLYCQLSCGVCGDKTTTTITTETTATTQASTEEEPSGLTWNNDLYLVFFNGISESSAVGTLLGQLSATDSNGYAITFSASSSGYLNVDPSTGRVTLAKALDRETAASVPVKVTATNEQNQKIESEYSITVLDVNDNAPIFLDTPYSFDVNEDTPTSQTVYSDIRIQDLDSGSNGQISVLCYAGPGDTQGSEACDIFKIELERVGEITRASLVLQKSLDYESRRSYRMQLQASDSGVPSKEETVTVAITVGDVQDGGPEFINPPFSLIVYENVEQGNAVGKIQARDTDQGNPSPVSIRMRDSNEYFSLSATTHEGDGVYSAEIISKGRLDKENLDGDPEFYVYAIEEVNGVSSGPRTETTVTVRVLDLNDNAPNFNQQNYEIEVDEYTPLSQLQLPSLDMIVSDADSGANAYFELSFVNEEDAEAFSLSPSSGTGTFYVNILVTDSSRLDYEREENRVQVLRIVAKETASPKQSTTATVTITLNDLNDNSPKFSQNTFSFSIRENRPVGTAVGTLTATDADSTNNYGTLTYSMEGEDKDMFVLNTNTGEITLAKALDFESKREYEFDYIATDGGGQSSGVPLRIAVLDYNDQGPIFPVDQYDSAVNEGSTLLNPPVVVTADDTESDAEVTYRIKSGNTPNNAFTIDTYSGNLTLTRGVSYDETAGTGKFELIIEASDNGSPEQLSTVPVVITIIDENDNKPQFADGYYYKTIPETTPGETVVVTVTATDADPGQNGEITYIIHSGHLDKFVINEDTGEIIVANGADLDLEKNPERYEMIVHAVDGGSPPNTATAQVIVTVTDENNKNPKFGQNLYFFETPDTSPVDTELGFVTATDPDAGSSIKYTILPNTIVARDPDGNTVDGSVPVDFMRSFKVDPDSGAVSIASELDGSVVAEVEFEVLANDTAAPTPQTSTTRVQVIINTEADKGLEFGPPWSPINPVIPLEVEEEIPVGTLIKTLTASDPETGQAINNFKKVDGTDPNNYFVVDPVTGEIRTNKPLDYETLPAKTLSFQVIASSDGSNPKTAVATINVEVLNINDNIPLFVQDEYDFDIPENTKNGSLIGVVVASDKDAGEFGDVSYELSGPDASLFTIDPKTGSVSVAPGVTLDYEKQPQISVTVTASDGGGKSTSIPVTISLTDTNDNTPEFDKTTYYFSHYDNVDVQTSLGQVSATDGDSGVSGIITYSLVSGNQNGIFYVESNTGVIRNKLPLAGRAREEPYSFTVEAVDGGKTARKATATVVMTIREEGSESGKPVIVIDDTPIMIDEEPANGYNVTVIQAFDSDLGLDGELEYGFVSNGATNADQSLFNIDPDTGLITVNGRLDRETKAEYNLMVYVRDKGNPPQQSTKVITIRLNDVNDQDPYFLGCNDLFDDPLILEVTENEPRNTFVGELKACDEDNSPYNKLYYYILSQDPATRDQVFKIDKDTGEIKTNVVIDREEQARYTLKIIASNDFNLNLTAAASDESLKDSVLNVVVDIADIDDNPPKFGMSSSGNVTLAAVSVTASYDTDIVQLVVVDGDSSDNSKVAFSIIDCRFFPDEGNSQLQEKDSPFTIDPDTGIISTTVGDFLDFLDGHFEIHVEAVDSQGRIAVGSVTIVVARDNQRLRYVFDRKPQATKPIVTPFIGKLNNFLIPYETHASPDSLHYHVEEDGDVDFDKANLCFHLIYEQKLMPVDVGIEALDKLGDSDEQYKNIMEEYDATTVARCEVKTTTKWWSGYWYLWWLLIALAIFIFVCSLIFIIFICYLWDKLKEAMKRDYMDPVHVATLSQPFHRPSELEWQEEVVQMG